MKLSVFVVLLFANIITICSCVIPKSKKIQMNLDGTDVLEEFLIMDELHVDTIAEKREFFPGGSTNDIVLRLIAHCVECNSKMYEHIYEKVLELSHLRFELSQMKENTTLFMNSAKLMQIKEERDNFEKKYGEIVRKIIPAYRINKHLIDLVQKINAKTIIDPKFVDILKEEDEKINSIRDFFWRTFQNSTSENYLFGILRIQSKIINQLEYGEIDLEKADERLNRCTTELNDNAAKINNELISAENIDFKTLEIVTKNIYSHFRDALEENISENIEKRSDNIEEHSDGSVGREPFPLGLDPLDFEFDF